MPILINSSSERIISLVKRIVTAKQRDAETDMSTLEQDINQLVYKLYGLSPEDIAIVEAAT